MPVLGYWKIRGLAQPIRLLLGYAEAEFEDKIYECTDGPEFNRECWLKEKFTLGLDFPNLPYYMDGDVKLTQSNAIMRHLARKHDLLGKTDKEKDRCDQVAEQLCDFRTNFVKMCYAVYSGIDFAVKGPVYAENISKALKPFEDFLGDNKWMAGDNLTWADFIIWEMLEQHEMFKPGCLADLPKLAAYHKRFKEEPKIKKFMESPKYFQGPCNNKMASWGGSYPVAPALF